MIEPVVCALLMRIKGGGHGFIRNKISNKVLHRLLDGKILSTIGFGILCSFHVPLATSALLSCAWLAGVAPSIGEEIGSVGGIKGAWGQGKLWGWKKGAIRGTYQGALLALASGHTGFIVAGALFPVAYFTGVSLMQILKSKNDWDFGEYIYGFILGVPLCLSL